MNAAKAANFWLLEASKRKKLLDKIGRPPELEWVNFRVSQKYMLTTDLK